jgi:glutamine amidotransferase
MQIMFEFGDEHGVVTRGLGLLPGGVTRLDADRVPLMGWNTVAPPVESWLFAGIPADSRFYFVHSYAARPGELLESVGACVTTSVHGGDFVAAAENGHLAVTQFHPEKSGDAGLSLLHNWIRTLPVTGVG